MLRFFFNSPIFSTFVAGVDSGFFFWGGGGVLHE